LTHNDGLSNEIERERERERDQVGDDDDVDCGVAEEQKIDKSENLKKCNFPFTG